MRTTILALCALSYTLACDSETSTKDDASPARDSAILDSARDTTLLDTATDTVFDGQGGSCSGSFPFAGPTCCDAEGNRAGSADCVLERWRCETPSTLCTCGGQPMEFTCSDFCGSDVFFEPTCDSNVWTCGAGMIKTSDCPAGTCWGDPGLCCDDTGQPVESTCKAGDWEWSAPCDPENCV